MAWNYNPKEEIAETGMTKYPAGRYWFSVENANEKEYKSKNRGMALKLSVAVTKERNIPVFENLMYVSQCQFKYKQMCEGLGLDYNNPPSGGFEAHHFEGKSGWGHFSPQGDKGYLGLDKVETAKANNGPDTKPLSDDVPF